MTPDIKTLDEAIVHKQFFINTIAKRYPDLDRDTIDMFISEVLYNIVEKDLITSDTNIRQYIIKALIYRVRREYNNERIRIRPTVRSPVIPIYHNDMLIHDAVCQDEKHTYDILRKSIYQLSKLERNAILLKYAFKMKYSEVALFLDIPLSTAKNRVFRATHALRKLIKEQQ